MVINLLCWCWIAVSAFLFGIAGLSTLKKINGYDGKDLDLLMIFGICLLTVYAQFFSLFCKVSGKASVVLFVLNVFFACVFNKDIRSALSGFKSKNAKHVLIVTVVLAFLFLYYASGSIKNYDTDLYHAQSIRWIEEYGVVPGLGNLHHRLAYNNSVFSLQALFSLRFLLGRSLHSINGFLGLLFMAYAVCSLRVIYLHRFCMSDFFRVGLVSYIISQSQYLSSPGSDFFALCMIFYVFIKWITFLEEKVNDNRAYISLCLLSVFAVSIKLSAAMLVILVLAPAVRLVREKQWKKIVIYILLGIFMILPFIIRNVIISGYLIYPYPEFDAFLFDWKIPEFTVIFDRNEVKAWGMGVNDFARYNVPFREWFPVWKKGLNWLQTIEVYLLPALGIASAGIAIQRTINTKQADYLCVLGAMIATISLWFFGAPGLRFGGIFLFLLPCFLLGTLLENLNNKLRIRQLPLIVILVLVIYNCFPIIESFADSNIDNILWGSDYAERACTEVDLEAEKFYIPEHGDQAGYDAFPSSPYTGRLEVIELRGDSLKDGFRVKEEYKDCFISNYGDIFVRNVFVDPF